jgi:cation diffusion facilitator CzcD-associated flavoprotein CzcO
VSGSAPDHDVAIVGAGFSGIGAAIRLDRAGISDYVVLEAGDGVGGAWHWNTYPGIAVDIPSFSYQFSFAKRTDWSRTYASGAELKRYAEDLVDEYGLRERIRLNAKVSGATFDEDSHLWRLELEGGEEVTARFVVGATGVFTQPKRPDIPGIDEFAGPTVHTAGWDHDLPLEGKRVGVIGTGASAVQVVPTIAPEVGTLTVFQRTPIWCLPKPDRPLDGRRRWALENVPGAQLSSRLASQLLVELTFPLPLQFGGLLPFAKRGEAVGRKFLREQVQDPEVRDKLTPRYGLGCKRPGFSNEYLATFNRDNVELETTAIETVTPAGIRTVDGTLHELDVLVLATGFKVFEAGNMPPYPVRGTGGVELGEWWDQNRFQAYEGVSVPGFPNLFSILGPYGYNGASYFQLIETQMRHIVRCLRRARRDQATLVEVRPEANDRYFRQMLSRRRHQIFFQGTCEGANSYYFDRHGDAPFRASPSIETHWRSARYDLDDYRYERLPVTAARRAPA